jgi:DNA-binding XRE family transcriptional regulator
VSGPPESEWRAEDEGWRRAGAVSRDNRDWGLGPEARERLSGNVMVGRLRAEMSRGELGSRAAVSTRRLGQIEEGKAAATLDVWVRIAGTLGVSLDELLAGVSWIPSDGESNPCEGSYVVRRKSN